MKWHEVWLITKWSLAILFLIITSGCAHRTKSTTVMATANQINVAILPTWPPKHPSLEYQHAAKYLYASDWKTEGHTYDLTTKTMLIKLDLCRIPAWEFFGLFDDEKIQQLVQEGQFRMPFRKMTPKQQAALRRYMDVRSAVMKGMPYGAGEDVLVSLYKNGAREDLSNVDVVIRQTIQRGLTEWKKIGIVFMELDVDGSQVQVFGLDNLSKKKK
jgi:hypothetical protein